MFTDLAHTLVPKVKQMNAHDVSSIVVAFSSIEYAHRRLFESLRTHAKRIVHTFSPLQLARTINGFGAASVDDPGLFKSLCEQVLRKQHGLHAKNIVEIVSGLVEAEYTPRVVLQSLLKEDDKLRRWLKAEDAIQLLYATSRLPAERLQDSCPEGLTVSLLNNVRKAAQGWWRFTPQDATDLVDAMQVLRCTDRDLLDQVCKQATRILSKSDSRLFMRFFGALAELPDSARHFVRANLHRRKKLRDLVEEHFTLLASLGLDVRSKALLSYACARLSYDGPAAEDLSSEFDSLHDCTYEEDWWPLLLWSMAEIGTEVHARRHLVGFLQKRFAGTGSQGMPLGSLLRVAWSCVVLEVDFPDEMLTELSQARADMDEDRATCARIVALECTLRGSGADSVRHLYDSHPDRRGRRPTEEPSDLWVSAALVKLRFSHESPYFVNGVHRVAAGSSRQCFAIDVLGPESLATPSQRELGSTMVRVRQMTALGWQREAVRSLDVVQEERAGQLVRFLSPLLPGTSQP